jgi:uncharacterized protein (DUF433 family)
MFKYILISVSIVLLVILIVPILKKNNKGKRQENIKTKFSMLIACLNEYCYQGKGYIDKLGKNYISLYKQDSCQKLTFKYELDKLHITWKFKYYQQEMIFEKVLSDLPDVTETWQVEMSKIIISEFLEKYKVHKDFVDSKGVPEEILAEFGVTKESLEQAREFLKSNKL